MDAQEKYHIWREMEELGMTSIRSLNPDRQSFKAGYLAAMVSFQEAKLMAEAEATIQHGG
jgi:hypothetical protein